MCCSRTSKQEAPTIFQVLVPSTQHELYVSLAVRREYSSPGHSGSTSTSSCATTTRLQPHALYVYLAVRRDYSSLAARALRQPRRAPRVLVSTLPAAAIYIDYAARPGASARRAARHAARHTACRAAHRRLLRAHRRLLRLRRASGCLGTSRGPSRGSSSTTPCAATSSYGHTGSTSATLCVATTCLAATLALLRVRRTPPRRCLTVASR
jgi:hypothetical protein